MPVRLLTPGGIGDIAWCYQKLYGLSAYLGGEPVIICPSDERPQRSEGFVRMLPNVQWGGYHKHYSGDLLNRTIKANKINLRASDVRIDLNGEYDCQANTWVERGHRLEGWMPEIPLINKIELNIPKENQVEADALMEVAEEDGPAVVGVYTSAYGAQRNWAFWDESGWFKVLKSISDFFDKKVCFVIVGADFDTGLPQNLKFLLQKEGIKSHTIIGRPFGVIAALFKQLPLFLAFPSGLPIVSYLLGTPTIWWLPTGPSSEGRGRPDLSKLPDAFINPLAVKSGHVESRWFESPEDAIDGILLSGPWHLALSRFAKEVR